MFDLHSHTVYSDGTLTPAELVARAHANGVSALAVTDHDVTDGLGEAQAAAAGVGIRLIPGVEISVTWERHTVHIVGLGIDAANRRLQCGLEQLREVRRARAQEIGRRLHKKNIPDAFDRVSQATRGDVVSRTHFARFLVSQGYVRDMGEAFKYYLGRGRAAHVPGRWARLGDALEWIRAADGVGVIAHPSRYPLSGKLLRRLLQEFRECGGAAIEVAYGALAAPELAHLTRLATDFGLMASAGSDFHGPENRWIDLGKLPPLAPELTPVWSALRAH